MQNYSRRDGAVISIGFYKGLQVTLSFRNILFRRIRTRNYSAIAYSTPGYYYPERRNHAAPVGRRESHTFRVRRRPAELKKSIYKGFLSKCDTATGGVPVG